MDQSKLCRTIEPGKKHRIIGPVAAKLPLSEIPNPKPLKPPSPPPLHSAESRKPLSPKPRTLNPRSPSTLNPEPTTLRPTVLNARSLKPSLIPGTLDPLSVLEFTCFWRFRSVWRPVFYFCNYGQSGTGVFASRSGLAFRVYGLKGSKLACGSRKG